MEKIIVDELLKKVGARYGLISLAAKRAHEMLVGNEKSMKASEIINKVFEEIIQGKITIKIKEEGGDESKQKESGETEGGVRRLSRGEKD